MQHRVSEQDSMALYFVKVIAILASVAAHVSVIDKSTPLTAVVTRIWDMGSCISVPGFLIVGGILYSRKPGDSRSFWTKKAKTMILPWIFCGLLTYGYRALYEPSSFMGLLCWILGHGSWLYYVTIYLFMLAVFKLIYQNIPALWCCVAITAVQLILKAKGSGIPSVLDNDYLNPVHWVGFFALGILLRKQGLKLHKGVFMAAAVIFAVSSRAVYRGWIYNYFHITNAVFTVSAFFVLFGIGRLLKSSSLRRWIAEIGTSTYCIYLLHILIVPPVLRRIPGVTFKAFLSPVLGVAIMMILIGIGKYITRKLPHGEKLRALVGLR